MSAGDTEAQVQARYSNRLQSSPHKYVTTGEYLTLVPTDTADSAFRLIFETDGTKVTRFRAGRQPEVSFVEGFFVRGAPVHPPASARGYAGVRRATATGFGRRTWHLRLTAGGDARPRSAPSGRW